MSWLIQGPGTHPSSLNQMTWNGFLFGIPLILAAFALTGARWALMAASCTERSGWRWIFRPSFRKWRDRTSSRRRCGWAGW